MSQPPHKPQRNRIADRVEPIHVRGARLTPAEAESLRRLAKSKRPTDRWLCVEYLKSLAARPQNRRLVLELADFLIPDRSAYVRWQTLLLLGNHYAASHPGALWPLVAKWGSAANRDIRRGVACCLLEHMLEYRLDEISRRA